MKLLSPGTGSNNEPIADGLSTVTSYHQQATIAAERNLTTDVANVADKLSVNSSSVTPPKNAWRAKKTAADAAVQAMKLVSHAQALIDAHEYGAACADIEQLSDDVPDKARLLSIIRALCETPSVVAPTQNGDDRAGAGDSKPILEEGT